MQKPLISITIPACNEAANLPILRDRLLATLVPLEAKYDFEIILLDNASTDATREVVLAIAAGDSRIRYVRYTRNFGFEASLLAGIDLARGVAAINMVSDLQDPPELIPSLIAKWEEGFGSSMVRCGKGMIPAGSKHWARTRHTGSSSA